MVAYWGLVYTLLTEIGIVYIVIVVLSHWIAFMRCGSVNLFLGIGITYAPFDAVVVSGA